jgi:hypothetical protein
MIARPGGVESVVSMFYAFLSEEPKGKIVIRLCDDIVDACTARTSAWQAFEEELGIAVGETTPDGKITLERRPCIGMCDQAPAALVNDVVVTELMAPTGPRDRPRPARAHGSAAAGARSSATATTRTSSSSRWCRTTCARKGR